MLGLLFRPIWDTYQSQYIRYSRENSQDDIIVSQGEVLDSHLEDLDSRGEDLEDTKYKISIVILLPLGSSQIPSAPLQDSDVNLCPFFGTS